MNSQSTSPHIVLRITVNVFSLMVFATSAQADIFQWEYINPSDPSQGKQQSTTLAPDGAGVDAVPYALLGNRNLTKAYLIGADLSNANGFRTNLTSADLSQANLINTTFLGAKLTDADFTGAQVRGTKFSRDSSSYGGTGVTLGQLYATASYQARDLTEIGLADNYLSGGNFAGQNLTNASFGLANLTGANFRAANLTKASFRGAALTNADFTDAEIRGANLSKLQFGCSYVCVPAGSGITPAQLYSTASYKAQDLSGIHFHYNGLAAGNFAGQNLTNADFWSATLTDTDFSQANLTNASFAGATLLGADFTSADTRGAHLDLTGASTANLIRPDGYIDRLVLDASGLLVVRDYDGNPISFPPTDPIPITVDQHLAMGLGGTLRMVFEGDAWDSTISFAPGIPVALGGTLEFAFAADVNLASQVGRTFDVFNWTGITPTGDFAVSSPYRWDLSNLYTTGEVTLIAVPEPGSGFLLGLGFTSVLAVRRVAQHRRNRVPRFAAPTCILAIAGAVRAEIAKPWSCIIGDTRNRISTRPFRTTKTRKMRCDPMRQFAANSRTGY